MLNHRSLSNQRGQVAIFIALMFNVLFIFFAMVINVGMLVHHKINLQNSVDLSAYYGASKQADMLNGIAHINYQIRQSWKLLAWRYRILGTLSYPNHPGNSGGSSADDPFFPNGDKMTDPVFCAVGFNPWRLDPAMAESLKNEDACQRVDRVPVPTIAIPEVIAGFISFNTIIREKAIELQALAADRGRFLGMASWFTLARYFYAYRQDQANRKKVMYALAKSMSESTEDFTDADNDSVKAGMEKTLRKNLTPENNSQVTDFRIYNSLGHPNCKGNPTNTQPPRWLSEIRIQPTMFYLDFDCQSCQYVKGGNFIPDPKELYQEPTHFGDYSGDERFKDLLDRVQLDQPWYGFEHSSLGVEKDPWCSAYVGVTASTKPNLPFSPKDIVLTAQAFAKPFGGRIGPWFEKNWPRGSPRSTGGGFIDPLVGPRIGNNGVVPDPADMRRLPNYSRFPGDPVGLNSTKIMGAAKPPLIMEEIYYRYYEDLWKILENKTDSPAGDILAWDADSNRAPEGKIREMEVAAMIPDIFDITYYSIEPVFYENYWNRFKKGLDLKNTRIRSDLGAREDIEQWQKFSVMSQLATAHATNKKTFDFENSMPYTVKQWQNLLTSLSGRDLINYVLDPRVFGRCDVTAKPDVATPGNCVSGGRTGYSVKLVSYETLSDSANLQLGGVGGGQGPILNLAPPVDGW